LKLPKYHPVQISVTTTKSLTSGSGKFQWIQLRNIYYFMFLPRSNFMPWYFNKHTPVTEIY